jgi:phage shock protein C
MSKRELFRDPVNGKITGVCAGIANYFEMEIWLVRILVISATLLGGGFLVILAYIGLSLMLEKQPAVYKEQRQQHKAHKLKSRHWEQGESASQLVKNLERDFGNIEQSVRSIEAYVTSEAYKVNKAFNDL